MKKEKKKLVPDSSGGCRLTSFTILSFVKVTFLYFTGRASRTIRGILLRIVSGEEVWRKTRTEGSLVLRGGRGFDFVFPIS